MINMNTPKKRGTNVPSAIKNYYKLYLPEQLRNKLELYCGKSDYYLEQHKQTGCIFIHVPKAAGTSISRALYGEQLANHYPAELYYNISKTEYRKYFVFSVVRNPWDRLVSAYEFIKQGGTKYVKPLDNSIYKKKQFSEFDTFVKEILDKNNVMSLDKVFHHQHFFICDKESNVLVDHVGKLENLNETTEIIESKIGRKLRLDVINKSINRSDYRSYYTTQTYEIVENIYSKDIELFMYEF